MQRVAAQGGVVLLELHLLLRKLLVTGGHVTGRALALLAGFGAFNDNDFASHGLCRLEG